MSGPLAEFLHPDGFDAPPTAALLREVAVLGEAGRYAVRGAVDRVPCRNTTRHPAPYPGGPVVLVPGFLAGDATLSLLAARLRREGMWTHRSQLRVNAGCTLAAAALLEQRLQQLAERHGNRVRIVGHSLGGLLARGLAVRRPDLISGIVTLGSPMLAPAAHHALLSRGVGALVRLERAGFPGVMGRDCVAGACARTSWAESRQPVPDGVGFTAVYSRRDGVVDWRSCRDPLATGVEVTASHLGLVVDPRVADVVVRALLEHAEHAVQPGPSVVEVDGRVGA